MTVVLGRSFPLFAMLAWPFFTIWDDFAAIFGLDSALVGGILGAAFILFAAILAGSLEMKMLPSTAIIIGVVLMNVYIGLWPTWILAILIVALAAFWVWFGMSVGGGNE